MGTWWEGGFGNVPEQKTFNQDDDGSVRRFWVSDKPGVSAIVSIVGGKPTDNIEETSDPLCCWEHELKLDGKWGQTFTCTAGMGVCLWCEAKVPRYYVGFYTAIEEVEFKTKKDEVIKNPVRLLWFKQNMLHEMKRKLGIRKTFIGTKWNVGRSGEKPPRSGNSWEYLDGPREENEDGSKRSLKEMVERGKMILAKRYGQEKVKLLDYQKILAPKPDDEIKGILAKLGKTSAVEKNVQSEMGGEDDIPF